MTCTEEVDNLNHRQSLWNRGLVALYIVLFFLDGVTRYKHVVSGLMYATALYYIVKYRRTLVSIFKKNIFLALGLFVLAIIYSITISLDPSYSIKKSLNKIFEQLLVMSVVIPILLHQESPRRIARVFIFSLISALIPLAIADGYQYYQEYLHGIMPFTRFDHKFKSDALIFMSPALLYLWVNNNKYQRIAFIIALPIVGFMILGTMQRGTWLGILIPAIIWCIVTKHWRLSVVVAIALAAVLSIAAWKEPQHFQKLFYKLQQTSSSARYGGGTQGSAMDLILENPVKGHGYGDDIFYNVYNQQVKDHPEWIFKKSIGPHNISLVYWFAAGLFGLLSLWYLIGSLMKEVIVNYRRQIGVVRGAWLLIGLITVGDLIVRGLFESVAIENLAMLLGITLALLHAQDVRPHRNSINKH